MHIQRSRKFIHWLIPLAIVGVLCIFSATFFSYAVAHAEHRTAGYTPGVLGVLLFASSMAGLSYLSLPGQNGPARLFTAIGIAVLESAVFSFLLLLLLVNSFGS